MRKTVDCTVCVCFVETRRVAADLPGRQKRGSQHRTPVRQAAHLLVGPQEPTRSEASLRHSVRSARTAETRKNANSCEYIMCGETGLYMWCFWFLCTVNIYYPHNSKVIINIIRIVYYKFSVGVSIIEHWKAQVDSKYLITSRLNQDTQRRGESVSDLDPCSKYYRK